MVEARLEANSVSKVKKVARAVKEFAAVALLTASLMFNCATSKHSEMSSQEYTIENAQICKRRNCPDMLNPFTFTNIKYTVVVNLECRSILQSRQVIQSRVLLQGTKDISKV